MNPLRKAEVLHKELAKHFEGFGKPSLDVQPIDDEICHHILEIRYLAITCQGKPWIFLVTEHKALKINDYEVLNGSIVFYYMHTFKEYLTWYFSISIKMQANPASTED